MHNDAPPKNSKHSMIVYSKSLARLGRSSLIFPVRFVGSTADVEFSPKLYAVSVLAVISLAVCGWVSLLNEVSLFWEGRSGRFNSASVVAMSLVHFGLLSSSSLMAVIGSPSRYKTLLDVDLVLIRIDKALDGTATTADKRVEWFAVYLVVHLALLFSLDFYMWMGIYSTNKSYTLAYAFHFINFISLAMYGQVAWSIGQRFDSINREMDAKLKRLTATTKCTAFVTRQYHDPSDLIQRSNCFRYDVKYIPFAKFQEFYWSLCHCIDMINQLCGPQLLLGLLQNVINLIVTPNVLIVQIINPEKWGPANVKVTVISMVWILTHLLYLFLMVIPPSYAATKAEQTAVTICQHLNVHLAPKDMKLLELFILQLQKFKINFTICGVVNLQRSIITTVIGTTITYLVIFIQFQNIWKLLQVLATTIPMSTTTPERTFSSLRILRTYYRNLTGESRLNGLALISVHREIHVDTEELLNQFSKSSRNMMLA